MNTLNCSPVIFGPHVTPHCPAAPWWHLSSITPANLGWWIVAFLIAGTVLSVIQGWITNRWEITRGRPRVTRRWYGSHARICLRAEADGWGPARYTVLRWDAGDTGLPWLLVHRLNSADPRYWDEDAEAFWAPVTDFAPGMVRCLRPHLTVLGRLRVPVLTDYRPVPVAILRGES